MAASIDGMIMLENKNVARNPLKATRYIDSGF
jgi:hypothetical protein